MSEEEARGDPCVLLFEWLRNYTESPEREHNTKRNEEKRSEVKRSEANEERTCTATDAERPSSAPCGEKIDSCREATVRDKAHVRGLKKIAERGAAGGLAYTIEEDDQRSRVGLGAAKERKNDVESLRELLSNSVIGVGVKTRL